MNWNLVEAIDLRGVKNLPPLGREVLMVFEIRRLFEADPVEQVVRVGALWQPKFVSGELPPPIFAEALDVTGSRCAQMGYQLRAWCELPSLPDPLVAKLESPYP